MSWVRRTPPGDPAYFCECPPCPFCFEWVNDAGKDRPRRRRRERATLEESSTSRQRQVAQRLVLPTLIGIAFALTLSLNMRHRNFPIESSRLLERTAVVARQAVRNHQEPPQPTAQRDAPAPTPPAPRRAPTAPPSVTDPSLPEVPVDLIVMPPENGQKRAILRNASGAPLLLTITVRNPRTGNQSIRQVALTGERTTKIEGGLEYAPGDQITVASSGYRDRVSFAY